MSADFSRIMLLTKDESLGTSFTPPTNATVIAQIFDPNNSTMTSTGLYTSTQVAAHKAAAYQHFIDLFGIDFLAGVSLGNGQYLAGDWLLLPYASGVNSGIIDVSMDTENKARKNGKWHAFQFGQIIASTAAGTFASGLHAGEAYGAGAVMAYWDYQVIKTNGGTISPSQPRENFLCYATLPGSFYPNAQGLNCFYSEATIIDSDGNHGYFYEIIYYRKDPVSGVYSTQTRQTITWYNPEEETVAAASTPKVEEKAKCFAHLLDGKK